MNGQVPGRY